VCFDEFFDYVLATLEPITSAQAARDYLAQAVNPTLLKGLTELCKQKPHSPVVSVLFWFSISHFSLVIVPVCVDVFSRIFNWGGGVSGVLEGST